MNQIRVRPAQIRSKGVIATLLISLIFALGISLAGAQNAWADEIIIGTGTGTDNHTPIHTFDSNGMSQTIYSKTEIGVDGKITAISFQLSSAVATYDLNQLRIWMGYSQSDTFSSASDAVAAEDLTLVYDGKPSPAIGTVVGWEKIELDTPFDYSVNNGNLVVVVSTKATKYASGVKYAVTTVANTCLYRGSDSDATYAELSGTQSYTKANYRANIKLDIETCAHENRTFVSTVAPTCEDNGYDIYHCSDCGQDIKLNETDALGHAWGEPFLGDKDGTANANGKYNVYVCSRDASHFYTTSADPTVWDGNASAVWTSGEGTEASPYLIESAANLAYLRGQVNAGTSYADTYFRQTVDLDLADEPWDPIGTGSSNKFAGHYGGNGHAISGLNVSNATGYAGLFGSVAGTSASPASISGLTVSGAVTCTKSGSSVYAGGLVGYASYVTISECGNEATVTSAGNMTGGIAGQLVNGTADSCFNHGDVTSTYAGGYTAGISGAGGNSAITISNCYNTGDITGPYNVAGITGYVYNYTLSTTRTIQNCFNTGTVTATGQYSDRAGGIAGYFYGATTYASEGKITNCYSLSGSASQDLIGYQSAANNATVTDSSAKLADEMKAASFVDTLGDAFIAGATYPVLSWEAPTGIPEITSQPADAAYVMNAAADALAVTATGDPANGELAYQWYKATQADLSDAAAISGATGATYVPATDALGDFFYYCMVNNDVLALDGSGPYLVQSDAAHVLVWSGTAAVAPTITTQPVGIESVGQGEAEGNVLSVVAAFAGQDETDANAELSYQWQVADAADGEFADIEGATQASFAAPTDSIATKFYRCVVTTTRERQSTASTTSDAVSVTVVGYTIDSFEKLQAFAAAVDAGDTFAGRTVALTADITITGDWNPVGSYSTAYTTPSNYFEGEFDGQGHTITFAANDATVAGYGLFAAARNTYIHDLVITGSINTSAQYAGALIGNLSGGYNSKIERVGNEADVTSTQNYACGLVGYNGATSSYYLEMVECYNKGAITASNYNGGLSNGGVVHMASCYNTGAVTATASSTYTTTPYVGGLHGYSASASTVIYNCYSTGAVTAPNNTSSSYVGSGALVANSSGNPTGENLSYFLDTSCARGNGGTSQNAGYVSKTATVFADETTDEGMLALLKVGDYAEAWAAGSALDPAQSSPVLAWEAAEPAVVTHTVTFDANGGTLADGVEATVEVEDGQAVARPADPTNGTTKLFDGWYNGDEEYDFATSVTEDLTLTAKWSAKRTITVTVKNAPADVAMVYEDVKTGVTTEFANKTMTGTTAMFMSTQNPGTYYGTHDAKITLSADGYEDLVIESAGKDGTNNISKTNQVLVPIEYAITYELDGGANAEANPANYTIETETIALADAVKDGFVFGGWFDNAEFTGEAVTEIAKGTIGDQTLYAKWTLDVSALNAAIEKAQAAPYSDELATSLDGSDVDPSDMWVTPQMAANLADALEKAQAAAAADGLTQAQAEEAAKALEDAMAAFQPAAGTKAADYSAVEAAIAKVPADMSSYTEESAAAVQAAVDAVDRSLKADEQAAVDAMAKAIEDAIAALEEKAVEPDPEPEPGTDPEPGDDEPQSEPVRFTDISYGTDWVDTEGWLSYVVDQGLMSGYKGTTLFGPDDPITREQVVTVLYRSVYPDRTDTIEPADYAANATAFTDLGKSDYAIAAINWAQQAGVVTGDASTGYTTFRPQDGVTREELATMLCRFATLVRGADAAGAEAASYASAPDAASVSDWAQPGMGWCFSHGVLTGEAATKALNPQGGATRAHMAKMITVTVRDVIE